MEGRWNLVRRSRSGFDIQRSQFKLEVGITHPNIHLYENNKSNGKEFHVSFVIKKEQVAKRDSLLRVSCRLFYQDYLPKNQFNRYVGFLYSLALRSSIDQFLYLYR
jgi:hypothetical protein